ncbi:MAG: (2Fe-2S) ferredoxin domain-containing protein [Cyanobacteria bacterium]|nr:(2Fe-2S) ferredoxin domain-containing protein [Cyanobacteriota bacterium]
MSQPPPRCLWICQAETCQLRGSAALLAALQASALPDGTAVAASGCLGQCSTGPSARVTPDETWYCRLTLDDITPLIENHLRDGHPLTHRLNPRFHFSFSMPPQPASPPDLPA